VVTSTALADIINTRLLVVAALKLPIISIACHSHLQQVMPLAIIFCLRCGSFVSRQHSRAEAGHLLG